jgi:hypothetical protein
LANAQTAYTTPVGYTTQTLVQGSNEYGITLHNPAIATGSIDAVSGTLLTDSDTTFSVTAGRTYILEITSGTLNGAVQDVAAASISGSTITTRDNLQAAGLQAGASYTLRLAPTLEEIFTTVPLNSGGVLNATISASTADLVWVRNYTGAYIKYYLRSGATPAFRNASTNVVAPNVPVIYTDGIVVQKKGATAATLRITGVVKKTGSTTTIAQGPNLLSIVAPAGLTLGNAGLEDDLLAALSAASADQVWIQQADLSIKKYYRRSGTSGGWRDVANPSVNLTQAQLDAIVLPSCIRIQKKGATVANVDLNVPTSYNDI